MQIWSFYLNTGNAKRILYYENGINMKAKIKEVGYQHEIYRSSMNTRTSYKQYTFPPYLNLASVQINELRFPGINYLFLQLETKEQARLQLEYSSPGHCVCFVIEGNGSFGDGISKSNMKPKQFTVQSTQELTWQSHSSFHQILFISFDSDRVQGLQLTNLPPRAIPLQVNRTLSEILQCTEDCPIRCIFIESKILSLLYLICEDMQSENPGENNTSIPGLSDADIQRLKNAEEYIVRNIAKNYTLIALAHEVGLNDFKLKKGFKALFGSTVFNYRHSIRMIKAKEMLESGFLVNEVSEEIGYKHAHHFSAAFKAYFDMSPSKINP